MYDTHEQHIYNEGYSAGLRSVQEIWSYVQEGGWNFEEFDDWLSGATLV